MAHVRRRPNGTWEIRESFTTPTGPRSRSLATFRELTDEVLSRAEAAARQRFDRHRVKAAARAAGAPVTGKAVDRHARLLLAELARGHELPPPTRRLLAGFLAEGELSDSARSASEWVAASPAERGVTLRDLLLLADRLPSRRSGALKFPALHSAAT